MVTPLFALYRFNDSHLEQPKIPGFFAVSTATANVEDDEQSNPLAAILGRENQNLEEVTIKQIAKTLYEKTKSGQENVELVVTIHGYNTEVLSIKDWYQTIWRYANEKIGSQNAVFLGYRWSSERVSFKSLFSALKSLPVLLAALLYGGSVGVFWSVFKATQLSLTVFTLCFATSGFLATLVLALMILRIIVYFRDSYRATNFGVPDLVELFRQLNKELVELGLKENKIKLSFIAHSMGGFVTTNVVRILSDVFDLASVGGIDGSNKAPSPKIGEVFRLSRLVLVSPDIPTLTIISGRANFLQSSLRRFEEAYLFSNEGDLALRLASTAANYFSFPTSDRKQGHRLGNVTVKPRNKQKDPQYGVVNFSNLKSDPQALNRQLVNYLEINGLLNSFQIAQPQQYKPCEEIFPDLFTYLDCTNYRDRKYKKIASQSSQLTEELTDEETQLLCYRLDRFPTYLSFLNAFVYMRLLLDWAVRNVIDVHGGYFEGEFTRSAIYKLAFTGLRGLLICLEPEKHYMPEEMDREVATVGQELYNVRQEIRDLRDGKNSTNETDTQLQTLPAKFEALTKVLQHHSPRYVALFNLFSGKCADKKIQVAFSPNRYESEVLGVERLDCVDEPTSKTHRTE